MNINVCSSPSWHDIWQEAMPLDIDKFRGQTSDEHFIIWLIGKWSLFKHHLRQKLMIMMSEFSGKFPSFYSVVRREIWKKNNIKWKSVVTSIILTLTEIYKHTKKNPRRKKTTSVLCCLLDVYLCLWVSLLLLLLRFPSSFFFSSFYFS